MDGFIDSELQGEPEIRYPCTWSYKIIGKDEDALRAAIRLVLANQEYEVDRSNQSRTGRYCSLALTLTVKDDRERKWIGRTLHEHDDVTMVL